MAVRSALPWPLRWVMLAVALGFCAAISLWAFEFGKNIAGLDSASRERVQQLRTESAALRAELALVKEARDKAQSIANTASTVLISEKVAQEQLLAQTRQLEADNRRLRDDLGFFEKLIPTAGATGIAIRGLQAEVANGRELKWQVLVIQPLKNPAEFNGRLEVSFSGLQNGKPWVAALPQGAQSLKFRQYGRAEGVLDLPPQTVVKAVTAKVLDGAQVKAAQTIKL
jgi:hypothetical protein